MGEDAVAGFTDPQLAASLLCVAAFLTIVPVHLVGLHGVATVLRRWPEGHLARAPFAREALFVGVVMVLLFVLHFLTNMLWGVFIQSFAGFESYRAALFYSFENYTSLGLTRVQVDERWRMLAPMISLSGVFCLAWSTAILVNTFSRLYSTSAGP
jgi:hypothetical protein